MYRICNSETKKKNGVRKYTKYYTDMIIPWMWIETFLCFLQVEVECALLDGEQESEMAQLQREKELLEELKGKINNTDKKNDTETSQVWMDKI